MDTNSKFRTFCQTLGLHPLVVFGLITIDWMMFASEIATLGTDVFVTIPVGFTLGIATALLQKNLYGDNIGTAVGKGLTVGLLTAIPTALPSLGILPFAVIGGVKLLSSKPSNKIE